jgi:hypothetical protein
MARYMSPNDLHVAAKGSGMPIFLLSGQTKVDESQDPACGGEVDSSANHLPSKAQIFTSLDEVPFGC